jgi:integrase/recombinase XerD
MLSKEKTDFGQECHLIKIKKVSQSSINQAYSAMKFFCATTLEREWNVIKIPRIKNSKKLPVVLSMEEVETLLGFIDNLKHMAILTTIYSGGMRVGEATRLKASELDGKRMTIRVQGGKGSKDRYTLLGYHTLELLRTYWKAYKPAEWLFPGANPGEPISIASIQRIFKKALHKASIGKKASVHTLRH